MKVETPVAKQTDYQLSYNQPAAATYDGWEKQALPVGNGEMGAKVFGLIGEERIQYNEKLSGLVGHNLIALTTMEGTIRTAIRFWQKFVKPWKKETAKKPNNWQSAT